MATRTGKVILSKGIRLDRSYKNVLSYTESQMLNLVTTKKIFEGTDFSFVRPDGNQIDIEIPYGTALQSNYMAFQNPDYSNKWFFAFIDSVEYISNKTTRFTFTIDEYSTWRDYFTRKQCFVVREHVSDDTIGSNLVPEQLELGEYVNNLVPDPDFPNTTTDKIKVGFSHKRYVVISIYDPKGGNTKYLYTNVHGVPISGGVWVFDSAAAMQNAMLQYSADARLDQVEQVYVVPLNIFDDETDLEEDVLPNVQDPDAGLYYRFKGRTSAYSRTTSLTRPSTLDGYTPKNNKLYTSPFMFIAVTNLSGTTNSYGYEYFSNPTAPVFTVKGNASVGCSILVYPNNYKGIVDNYNEGIMQGKLPTLSWSGDSYTNWLTQNAVNINAGVVGDIAGSVIAAASGLFSPNAVSATLSEMRTGTGLFNGVASTVSQIYQHSIAPITSQGNTNGGDMLTGDNINSCYAYAMSIKYNFAKRIDDFFTMFGYKVNSLKVPNESGRPHWNFVQIADGDDIGFTGNDISVPTKSMDTINNIYRAGVTIWHNHDEIGNYALDNRLGQ